MSKEKNLVSKTKCSQCGAFEVVPIRRTEFYKGVLIENLPATRCSNCGEELYDLETVRLMEKVAAAPQKYAQMMEMPVARIA
ncbi:MAG: YgiT-type zinc finger protein [Acidobacteria bacterium]|nr:YgiT-type zinc finger protein [Acidobacteriota bacterium]